ncbi:MAG: hypothetical protein ACYDEB_08320 [Dehalococcoidia bacterium]
MMKLLPGMFTPSARPRARQRRDAAGVRDATRLGPDLLEDRGLLARWFILYRLEQEMARARRYRHPLSVAVLRPETSLAGRLPGAMAAARSLTEGATARPTDLVGWLDDTRILVVLPETEETCAAAAIDRWRAKMWVRNAHIGGVKWQTTCLVDARCFAGVDALVRAVTGDLAAAGCRRT